MGKSLYIAEKPSVAMEFAKALKENMTRHDGYQESANIIVTWCVGHLVTMSYPEVYDPALKKWNLNTLPFIPNEFKYEIIPAVRKQFNIVKGLLTRSDVDTIYVCTDSGREGEYIYRLVAQEAGVKDKVQKRVWIDSQTEEEILRGIAEAKDESEYDNLSASAYLRAKEDYLMGINFSRLLTLKYGNSMAQYLGEKYCVVSVGRVMTCVLGMIVRREREIRQFEETPFYRVFSSLAVGSDADGNATGSIDGEWRAVEGSAYYQSPKLYKENGFKEKKDADALIASLKQADPFEEKVVRVERKTEKKNAPLLYNLAELQNDCSKMFKISPDQTLAIVQELYEKKLVTYPRTDARVLSTAVAKVIRNNISGLRGLNAAAPFVDEILAGDAWKKIDKTRYTNDKQITDHYAIIPTGQGLGALGSLKGNAMGVYLTIVKRFLGIFYPPAQYKKISLVTQIGQEKFFSGLRVLADEGWMRVMKKPESSPPDKGGADAGDAEKDAENQDKLSPETIRTIAMLKPGTILKVNDLAVREGKTSPPKRYNSGSMILAMENAGQLIEDEDLREQIKGAGIGTSATRAEILKKLVNNRYIALNKKTQILTPTLMGEMIFDVVNCSIRSLLSPELTASWEKGLNYVAEGSVTPEEYMVKLDDFIVRRTDGVKGLANQAQLRACYDAAAMNYRTESSKGKRK